MPPLRAAARGPATAAWGPLREEFTNLNLPGEADTTGGRSGLFAVGAGGLDRPRPGPGTTSDRCGAGLTPAWHRLRTGLLQAGVGLVDPGKAEGRPACWPNRPSLPCTTRSVVLPRAAPRPSYLG